MRKEFFIVGIGAMAGIAWYLASPLFIDKSVFEPFPLTTNLTEQLTPEELIAHDATMQDAGPDTMMKESVGEMLQEAKMEMMREGMFVSVGHEGSGKARMVRAGDAYVLRLENLDVLNGPDLRVVLSPNKTIRKADDLGAYLELGMLKGNKGDQNYAIPEGVDVSGYLSAVIYCKAFHVVFNAATLE